MQPKTGYGKLSVGLIYTFFLLFFVFQVLVALGQRGGSTFWDNLFLAVPVFIAGISGISSFLIGIFAFMHKERSILVSISTLLGFLVLIFVLGEIVSPH